MRLYRYSTDVEMFDPSTAEARAYSLRASTDLFDQMAREKDELGLCTKFLNHGFTWHYNGVTVRLNYYGESLVTFEDGKEITCHINIKHVRQLCYSFILEDYMV